MNMRALIAFVVVACIATNTFATVQFPEDLIMDGQTLQMTTYPLT